MACEAFLTFGRLLSNNTLSARLTLCNNIKGNRDTSFFSNAPRRRYLAKQISCAEISHAGVCTHNYCNVSILRYINLQVCNNTTLKNVQKAVFCMLKGGKNAPYWRLKRLQKMPFDNAEGHLLQHERP